MYTDEKNAQVVVSLLKQSGIKKVIASPGTTNMALVVSMQNDPYFEMYSAVDERSAAYMACGLAAESGEPVVISCTGATASRNYAPGLTEAYYRKLPVLAITSSHELSKVGHHVAQIIDRSTIPNDVANLSISMPLVKDDNDLWDCVIKTNQAILALKRHGGGPVHMNLPTTYSRNFETKELPKVKTINRITPFDEFPEIGNKKVAVFIGAHKAWTKEESDALDNFCQANNSVVFCDHTSSYQGKYKVQYSLVAAQKLMDHSNARPNIFIHIGEVSGDYYMPRMVGDEVWRVSEDGEIRDTFRKIRNVFEMSERTFFEHYANEGSGSEEDGYLKLCKNNLKELRDKIPELPFSNIWIASRLADKIPQGSTVHFGILNSLRSWNFFELPESVTSSCNVGGFGIDGNISSLLGASLVNQEKLYFAILGDLAFFYDMNSLGNRHVGNNIRILLVNNGVGTEFRHNNHRASGLGDDADKFVAARGHFGQKSSVLVKHYAEDLGFEYISSSDKESFENSFEKFIEPSLNGKPILLEVFTNSDEESTALDKIMSLEENVKEKAKELAKQFLGKKGLSSLKQVIKK